jgi:hypothetical protein
VRMGGGSSPVAGVVIGVDIFSSATTVLFS